MENFFNDDKNLVIISLTAIAIYAMTIFGIESKEIVIAVTSGLLGLVIGKKI